WLASTADALERVVGRRPRVLDPPVAAAQANVLVRNAGARGVAVHRAADRKRARRCRAVGLALVRANAVAADTGDVRAAGFRPATVDARPGSRGCIRRAARR